MLGGGWSLTLSGRVNTWRGGIRILGVYESNWGWDWRVLTGVLLNKEVPYMSTNINKHHHPTSPPHQPLLISSPYHPISLSLSPSNSHPIRADNPSRRASPLLPARPAQTQPPRDLRTSPPLPPPTHPLHPRRSALATPSPNSVARLTLQCNVDAGGIEGVLALQDGWFCDGVCIALYCTC
jgi:hypothetical protein